MTTIRCPVCGGVANEMWFSHLERKEKRAVFVVECWSGDLEKPSKHHFFLAKIKLKPTVYPVDDFRKITMAQKDGLYNFLFEKLEEFGCPDSYLASTSDMMVNETLRILKLEINK